MKHIESMVHIVRFPPQYTLLLIVITTLIDLISRQIESLHHLNPKVQDGRVIIFEMPHNHDAKIFSKNKKGQHAVRRHSSLNKSANVICFAGHAFIYVQEYKPVICVAVACITGTEIESSAFTSGLIKVDM